VSKDGIGATERFILYWIFGADGGCRLGAFEELDDHADLDRHRVERECFIAGVSLPTYKEARLAAQALIDAGYASAYRDDNALGRRSRINDLNAFMLDDWETILELTDKGAYEAKLFRDLVTSAEGRAKSMEFAVQYVARQTTSLPFKVIIPNYIPEVFDPLPDVIT